MKTVKINLVRLLTFSCLFIFLTGYSQTIPLSEFDGKVDPNTWSNKRPAGNLVVAGTQFTPNQTMGKPNYGFSMDAKGAIHSFQMTDGKTLRWGAVDMPGLKGKAIEAAHQWATNAGYKYVPGLANLTVKSPPNDQLFHDGTRSQMSFGELPISSGNRARRFLFGTLVKFDEGIIKAKDPKGKSVIFSIHAPNFQHNGKYIPLAGGLGTSILNGNLIILTRTESGNKPTGGKNKKQIRHYNQPIPANEWIGFVYEGQMSSNNRNNPYLKVWMMDAQGNWTLIVDYKGPFGYDFSGYNSKYNDGNYPIMAKYYQFHNWGNVADTNYKVRRLWYGFAGIINGNQYSSAEMMNTVQSFLKDGETPPPTPPSNEQIIADGIYHLEDTQGVQRATSGALNSVVMANAAATEDQLWRAKHLENDVYTFQNIKTGLYLETADAICENRANVKVNSSNTESHQKWKVAKQGDFYTLAPQHCPDRVLDRERGERNANVIIWAFNPKYGNQRWALKPTGALGAKLSEDALTSIHISPNPTNDVVYISGITAGDVLTIYDSTGRLVINTIASGDQATFDLNNAAPGLYFVKINDSKTQKILKQ